MREGAELFSEVAWVQVLQGQGVVPGRHHPLAELLSEQEVAEYLDNVRQTIAKCVDVMPDHAAFVAEHCAAAPQAARR